jgi:predicted MFS family arabinose efflux permease
MAAVMIAMVLTPHAPPALRLPVLLGLLFLLGVTGGVILIPVESFLQVRPAPHEKGSVLASVNFVVFTGILLSGFIANGLNALCRPTTAFACLGVGSLAASAWLFRAYRKEEETPCSSH